MAKLWQFRQGHPKAALSEKVQRGDEEKFFEVPQKQPSLKRANSTLAEMALSSNQCAVKVQGMEKIVAQEKAPKVPERFELSTIPNSRFWPISRF